MTLNRLRWVIAAAVACMGCEGPTTTAPASSPAAPPPAIATDPAGPPLAPGEQAAVPRDRAGSATPIPPQSSPAHAPAAASPAATGESATAPQIRLSAGVALAQTLPDGTSVMISMDYLWQQGSPQQGVEYLWVVELGNGQRLFGPANMSKRRGTIQAILRGIKPDQGPFQAAIFGKGSGPDSTPVQLSEFINLKK